MMFASKTPRDLSCDPEPYRKLYPYNVGRSGWPIAISGTELITEYDPRPEYDHPQHNEPNPILSMYRQSLADRDEDAMENALSVASGWPTHYPCTQAQRDHARRVLTRIASLADLAPEGHYFTVVSEDPHTLREYETGTSFDRRSEAEAFAAEDSVLGSVELRPVIQTLDFPKEPTA